MNVAKASALIADPEAGLHALGYKPEDKFVSFICVAKIKTKSGLYFTAEPDFNSEPTTAPLVDRMRTEAAEQVRRVVAQMEQHGGWLFEYQTVWVSKSEIAMIFADVTLTRENGSTYN